MFFLLGYVPNVSQKNVRYVEIPTTDIPMFFNNLIFLKGQFRKFFTGKKKKKYIIKKKKKKKPFFPPPLFSRGGGGGGGEGVRCVVCAAGRKKGYGLRFVHVFLVSYRCLLSFFSVV